MRRRGHGCRLIFSDVFVPDFGMLANVVGKQFYTFLGIEIDDAHADGAQPVETALKIAAFANDQRTESEFGGPDRCNTSRVRAW